MKGLREEIVDTKTKSLLVLDKNKGMLLPTKVPYVGMGSSYFAPLTLKGAGVEIYPEIASEFYYYDRKESHELGVLLSQSGESSETVWCLDKFKSVVSVVNDPDSSLAVADNVGKVVQIWSGEEKYSSTKSYINTLISLYLGFGIDPAVAVKKLKESFDQDDLDGEGKAQEFISFMSKSKLNGLYVIGSGPNLGTVMQGALVLSETTKLPWQGMSVAQYDHGPKEVADRSVVLIVSSKNGKDRPRIKSIKKLLSTKKCLVIDFETQLEEKVSPIHLINQINLFMYHLAVGLNVGETFVLGGKVTTVDDSAK